MMELGWYWAGLALAVLALFLGFAGSFVLWSVLGCSAVCLGVGAVVSWCKQD